MRILLAACPARVSQGSNGVFARLALGELNPFTDRCESTTLTKVGE